MALLIAPDLDINRPNFEDVKRYSNNKDVFGVIKQSYVNTFNEATVKSAERIVLHQKKEDWLVRLVLQFSKWRVEAIVSHLPTERGTMIITRQQPIERND